MLGIQNIKLSPDILSLACEVDQFAGFWAGLQSYTTGLQVLGDVAEFGANFQQVFGPLQEQTISPEMLHIIHATQVKTSKVSGYKKEENKLPVVNEHGQTIGFIETALPEDVEPLMRKLIEWLNDSLADEEGMHPLLTVAIFTSVFLQISPYHEGNFRVARFMILLLMLKSGYTYAPYVPLDKIMAPRGEEIYRALKHNQESLEAGHPDWNEWLRCFFGILIAQSDVIRERFRDKRGEVSNLPTLSAKILMLFEKHDRLQMKEIIKKTNGRRATVKLRLNELIDGGYLKRHGAGRSTWYAQV